MAAVLLCAAGMRAAEPTFTNVTATVVPGLRDPHNPSVAWADYDNDGRLDFLFVAPGTFQLFHNTGNSFEDVAASLVPGALSATSVAWGDYDNDGWLDFLVTISSGYSATDYQPATQIWRNTGSGFTNVTSTVAPGLSAGYRSPYWSGAWADFDSDGRLDFVAIGGASSQLWRNTGNGFTNVSAKFAPGLPKILWGSVAWGDYDSDGRPDLFISGTTKYQAVPESDFDYIVERVTQIWRNTGHGFINVTASVAPGLPTTVSGSIEWADFDNDGWLDFFFLTSSGPQLWRNTGGVFTNVTASVVPALLNAFFIASVAWGDYDNDGRLDFLLTGASAPPPQGFQTQLWRNTGIGFTNVTAIELPGLPGVVGGSVTWADYDNDGRLDFLLAGALDTECDGCDEPDRISQLWRNNTAQTNPPPAVITKLPGGLSQNSVTLNGQVNPRGHAAQTWFVWGDSTNYGQVTAAQPLGNGHSFSNFAQSISGLSAGMTYFYRAVGSNEQGLVFWGGEQYFQIAAPAVTTTLADNIATTSATLNGHAYLSGLPAYGWFEWGLTPAYGQATPVQFLGAGFGIPFGEHLSLPGGQTYFFRAAVSNSLGVAYGAAQSFVTPTFANVTATVAPGLPLDNSAVAWGDYDNDGRLDFILTGGTMALSQIWRNTGNGFTNVTATVAPGLPQVLDSSVAWGDYDNDGRLDFFLTGYININNVYGISQIWRNTGNGFTNVTGTVAPGLPRAYYSSVAWGDYDNDGRLDFLITGSSYPGIISQIWRNTGSGFTNVTATVAPGLPPAWLSSVAWGDYDNDGRLDFLLTGYTNDLGDSVSQLWRNTGSGFADVTATVVPGLPKICQGSVAWGDYDNDGRLDFLITGATISSYLGPISQLWRNTGSGFTNVTDTVAPGLPEVIGGSVAWGDYDNDGQLDFLFTAYDAESDSSISQVWRNTGSGFTNATATVAPGLSGGAGSVAWSDYDNDGRLDFLFTGYVSEAEGSTSQLWRNYTPLTNTPPSAPTGLAMTATTNAVMLSWNSATDGQTPASGLTYNVRVGTTPGGNNLLSAHVNATNGFRRVPAMGNAMLRHSLPLTGLTNGQTVYWSVQAVDTSFAGGPFATETSVVSLPMLSVSLNSQPSTLNLSWTPPTFGWILQQSTNLSGSNWTATPGGNANPTILSASNGTHFYRLARP